jgi:ADP-heptose:LPS heptosyltransferase
MHVVAHAPHHLGDGVLALPALAALARVASQLTIQAPAFGADLYRGLGAQVTPPEPMRSGDVAVLFPPSLRAAWWARRVPRRVGTPTDFRGWLLTDRVEERTHRFDTYGALARAVGAEPLGAPEYAVHAEDPAADVPNGHIGFNPLSVSGAVVEWQGYADLAQRWADWPFVFYAGPGEGERLAPIAGAGSQRVGLSLPAFASALRRCALFVSNDSGAAHFARACGVPTLVIHGSTIAARTGPRGAVAVEGPSLPCRPCYRKRCVHALECLDIGVERVDAEMRRLLGGA